MQFVDLRTILRLPLPGLTGGCNLPAATAIFNIISGASVCFFNASINTLSNQRDRGPRFKDVLKGHYPWQGEPLPKDDAILILYNNARNPLVHSLGLDSPALKGPFSRVVNSKEPLSEMQIEQLENQLQRPQWAGSTLSQYVTLAGGDREVTLSVPALYWGVHRMLHSLFADATQVALSDQLASIFRNHWEKTVEDSASATDQVSVTKR